MWLFLAFLSAINLGFYDVFKKHALRNNAVIPVLFFNTLFSALIFLPFIIFSYTGSPFEGSNLFSFGVVGLVPHLQVVGKAFLVLGLWLFGYFAMKHLPITIVGPINATRPIMVLVGAFIIFGERLNLYQWMGVTIGIVSFFLLSISGKKEGINFKKDKWVLYAILASLLGASSGLYDKFLMKSLHPLFVQSWFVFYQAIIMSIILYFMWYPTRHKTTKFGWRYSIVLIPIFLAVADFFYYYALTYEDSLITIISMIRRGSVVVSFTVGAILFKEKNIKSKFFDLILVIIGLIFLYLGTR